MQKWVINILVGVLSNPQVQEFLIQAAKRIVGDAIVEKVLGYLPAMFASMLDTAIQQMPGVENIQDIKPVVDAGRAILDKAIPDFDTGFKPLDDLMDAWRPH